MTWHLGVGTRKNGLSGQTFCPKLNKRKQTLSRCPESLWKFGGMLVQHGPRRLTSQFGPVLSSLFIPFSFHVLYPLSFLLFFLFGFLSVSSVFLPFCLFPKGQFYSDKVPCWYKLFIKSSIRLWSIFHVEWKIYVKCLASQSPWDI